MDLGESFGRFTVLGKIGVGGMGTVYAGFDHDLRDFVAIKTLISDYSDDERAVQRFLREASLYSRISHPNVVGFVEAGEEAGIHYIGLEYVRGRSLADIIETDRKTMLPFDRVLTIVAEVAKALQHIHALEILHRDIKPSNIILTQDDTVKLLDFGIALAEDGMDLTSTGMIVGTFVYSSPEQNQGRVLDERSDLYALGCVFFELLTGQRALPGNTMTEVAKFQALPQLALPSHFNPAVPPELDAVVTRLLMPRAKDRYQDAGELLRDLDRLKALRSTDDEGHALFGDEVGESWEMAKEAFSRGHVDAAMEQATYYLAQRPEDPRAHFLMGKLYVSKRLQFNATEAFGTAIELAPDSDDYRLDFALALYRLDMFNQCRDQAELIVARTPENVPARGLAYLAAAQMAAEQRWGRSQEGEGIAETDDEVRPSPGLPPAFGGGRSAETYPTQETPEAQGSLPYGMEAQRSAAAAEDEEAAGHLRRARTARFLSAVFPGLGNLYAGDLRGGLSRVAYGLALLGGVAGAVLLAVRETVPDFDAVLAEVAPPLAELSRALYLEYLVGRYGRTTAPGLAALFGLIFILHWLRTRTRVYSALLARSIAGKILHVREDGTVKLNRGSIRGVELGQRFTVLKSLATRELHADEMQQTVERRLSWVPIAVARVTKVRRHTSVAVVTPLPGITVGLAEGNRVEPIL